VVSLFAAHVDNEMYLSRSLERLGGNALSKDQEPDIGAAFLKFAVVTKELSALMKTLVSTSFILSELRKRLGEKTLTRARVCVYVYNKKFWEELIAYFPSYDTGHIENDASDNYSLLRVYSLPR
jgi:hypothetical protein